jgi:subtilisin family serine protease
VGIIDLLFKPATELEHLSFVDPQRLAKWGSLIGAEGHGQQVSAVLAGRGPDGYRGLASKADIFFVDASMPGDDGSLSRVDVDHARVQDGIRNLSKNHQVDIINLSCGFGGLHLPDLEDKIEEAADLGTLCICAAGNSGNDPVEVPARYDAAVAVGGIGFTQVADPPTCLGHNAAQAEADGLLGTFVSRRFGQPFVDKGTSFGPEIDALAPSMGVVIKSSGGAIFDCNGTSYATPIVSSVLACALANDQIYRELKGRERHVHARRRLDEISVDLGLPPRGSGAGLPVLQS